MKQNAVIVAENSFNSNWLGTSRSLSKKDVPVIRLTSKNWYNSNSCLSMLSPDVVQNKNDFLNFLIKLGKQTASKDVLFPSGDTGLMLISKNKEKLEKYFEPIASPWDVTTIILDKGKTFELAKKLNIPVPETFIPEDLKEVRKIAQEITFPCLVKPAHSHSFLRKHSEKLIKVYSKNELLTTFDFFSSQGYKLIIQEEVAGRDDSVYSFNAVFNSNSEPLAVFLGQKIRQFPPYFGAGSFARSVWNQELVELGVRLLRGIGFRGIAGVEFKKDEQSGTFKLIEINGRSWAWNYLSTFCGLNFAYIAYLDAIGEKQKPLTSLNCNYKLGLEWLHIAYDFNSFIAKRRLGDISFSTWMASLLNVKKTFAFLSFSDPLPFVSELNNRLIGNRLKHLKLHFFKK